MPALVAILALRLSGLTELPIEAAKPRETPAAVAPLPVELAQEQLAARALVDAHRAGYVLAGVGLGLAVTSGLLAWRANAAVASLGTERFPTSAALQARFDTGKTYASGAGLAGLAGAIFIGISLPLVLARGDAVASASLTRDGGGLVLTARLP